MAGGTHQALWSYNNGPPPPFLDPESESEDADAEAALPRGKRRKLQQKPAPEVITLEDDTDPDEASDGDTEEGGARRGGAEQPSQDSLRLSPTPASLPQPAQLDPETQRLLERNKKALDALEKAAQEEPIDLISSSDEEAPPSPVMQSPTEEEHKIQLVVQCKDHKKTMAMASSKPLQRLFDAWKGFAVGEGWIAADTHLRFAFDGDPLKGTETPTELGLEAEDVIEVVW